MLTIKMSCIEKLMSDYEFELSSSECQSIRATIFLLIVGYLTSLGIDDPTMFARFGALIVCLGVVFSMKGFSEIMESARSRVESHADELREWAEQRFVEESLSDSERKAGMTKLESHLQEYLSGTSKTIDQVKQRLLKIEGGVIIIGTLVWGFGDFLVIESLYFRNVFA